MKNVNSVKNKPPGDNDLVSVCQSASLDRRDTTPLYHHVVSLFISEGCWIFTRYIGTRDFYCERYQQELTGKPWFTHLSHHGLFNIHNPWGAPLAHCFLSVDDWSWCHHVKLSRCDDHWWSRSGHHLSTSASKQTVSGDRCWRHHGE